MRSTGSLGFNNLLLRWRKLSQGCAGTVAVATVLAAQPAVSHDEVDLSANPAGLLELVNVNGRTDRHGAFFQSLGTNGRTCATCHVADQGMSISPPQVRERYERTNGRDPLFASVDGANCAGVQRTDRRGHSLLLKHGLIRIPIGIAANAQFTISVVKDPTGCALVADPKTGLLTAGNHRIRDGVIYGTGVGSVGRPAGSWRRPGRCGQAVGATILSRYQRCARGGSNGHGIRFQQHEPVCRLVRIG